MDLSQPARAVVPSLAADVLMALAGTTAQLSGRQIHRLVPTGSWSGVRKVLLHLAASGLVNVVETGNANLYTLNREHVAAPAVLALTDLRGELFGRISAAIDAWRVQPVAASVFGSAARGDGGPDSDIDVFLVRPETVSADDDRWSDQVAALSGSIRDWSGNPGSIIQATPSQVLDMLERNEPIVAELQRDETRLVGGGVLGRRVLGRAGAPR